MSSRGGTVGGPEVWNPEDIKILGTPVTSQRIVQEVIDKRLTEEQRCVFSYASKPHIAF